MHQSASLPVMRLVGQHIFLLIGLGAVLYFFLIDLKDLTPGLIHYAIFVGGFISMLIYVVQSFLRFRDKWKADQRK